ncbi:4-hydroxy-3-methylbut-2-enyl diphosphate reductase [Marinigracilibium pacificum]|uniref:4-hydroxy-3-methylbut-2-enyl diphosphate reductase n=1 Tax=Marinigracilibium pacificum TaxID=2729599 RepID=A0A848IZK7_9BACT|nr:4-hydroxy-3-methylbut-2-enyl diphosphate reductase [Marinigracilibium pacificum]NMM49717.1 4-hydroxy-3-methylbut-2-enyl diphosphate reductase [Marinigracilibium pacificum]
MKSFDIPSFYRSPIISRIKEQRKVNDRTKKDFTPTELDFGPVKIYVARHFGFCYGVENAIEIIYKTVNENQGKRIFLLSEMIHNPKVNQDLHEMGVRFIMDTKGNQFVSWDEIGGDDIVVIPAFGTTVEIEDILKDKNIDVKRFDTTCPFVVKVWKRAGSLGDDDYTVVIHGKSYHEETRATFSHAKETAPALVVQNIEEAKKLKPYILKEKTREEFFEEFADRYSEGFDPEIHFDRIGVVNQTTMLAEDTQEITDYLREVMLSRVGEENISNHFANTRDTLCYATSDNQGAVRGMLEIEADLAIVVGGYNSSNTSHLVDLCEEELPTYHISDADKILSEKLISHYLHLKKEERVTEDFLPSKTDEPVKILITSGASCPDAMVDDIIRKVVGFYESSSAIDEVIDSVIEKYSV